jgi:hypothetical protein
LLRASGARRQNSCAANEGDEFAAFHPETLLLAARNKAS